MGIIAKEGGQQRELLPAGNTHGVCYGIIDLGTQESKFGKKHECCVLFETPSARYEDDDGKDKPRGKNKWYSISLHEKSNMGKDLASWRGKPFTPEEKKGFDITHLIGANCLLNIQHQTGGDGNVRDNISSITPLMAGMNKRAPENKVINYSIADDGFNFDGVPEWAVKKIKESDEYKNQGSQQDTEPPVTEEAPPFDPTDEIPF